MLPSFQSWFFEQRKRSLLPSSCFPFPALAAGSTAWALETTGRSAVGHLCPWSRPCQEPSPREAHRRKKRLGELGDIITAFIFCPSHYPRKQQSQTPTAFLLNVSLGTMWRASSWSHKNWLTCKCEQAWSKEAERALPVSFISWCCKLLRQM